MGIAPSTTVASTPTSVNDSKRCLYGGYDSQGPVLKWSPKDVTNWAKIKKEY